MADKELFEKIFADNIHREGSENLLSYLNSSDFFTAPASTKYHLATEGGLAKHSIHVYDRLKKLVQAEANLRDSISEESIAVCSLLHDLCKINFYVPGTRNVKGDDGKWHTVPTYTIDEEFVYGHGEKSVYIASAFMKLTREEAVAIRFHMGAWNSDEKQNASKAFEKYPLAFLLHTADEYATFIDEVEHQ